MSKAVIVIPARYGSSRLPGKPLLDIVGKPMIQHVYERALQVVGVAEVWVATDDQRVEKAVQAFGGKSIMTRNDHESGTDRLVEVMHKVEADININLQGDEPMIRPRDVGTLLQGMRDDPALPVATLCHAISAEEATEPSTVKVVVNTRQDALYFSRSPIPYPRNAEKARWLKTHDWHLLAWHLAYSASGEISGATMPETFSAAPCSAKRRCYRRVGTSSQRGETSRHRQSSGKTRHSSGRWICAFAGSWRQWRAAAFSGGG